MAGENLVSPPGPGTATRRVWDIADEITERSGRRAARAEVIKRFQEEGGNYNTASTQYHLWKKRYEAEQGEAPPSPARPLSVRVKDGGRVVLPAELRALLEISEGDTLSVDIVDGEIRLTPPRTAIRKAQALVRQFIPAGGSLVDDLIAERREDAERENSE